jgi:hypothetical protein
MALKTTLTAVPIQNDSFSFLDLLELMATTKKPTGQQQKPQAKGPHSMSSNPNADC